jgi:hypothetical protein
MSEGMEAETTMTVGWIAEHLTMDPRGYLNHLSYCRRKLGGYLPISRTDPFTVRRGGNGLRSALEERRGMEEGEEFKPIRLGWCLGE